MADSINRWSPKGLAAILSVLDDATAATFEDGTLMAMILCDTNTLAQTANWDATEDLDGFGGTLDEYLITGSAATRRIAVTVDTIDTSNAQVRIDFEDIVWPSLLGTHQASEPSHVLVYMEKFGAAVDPSLADRTCVAIFDGVFTPDGTTFTALQPNGGALLIDT